MVLEIIQCVGLFSFISLKTPHNPAELLLPWLYCIIGCQKLSNVLPFLSYKTASQWVSSLTAGAEPAGSSCCAPLPLVLPAGDADPVPSRGPFQPPHPSMQWASGSGPPPQEKEYFFHLLVRWQTMPALTWGCALAARSCRVWLKLLDVGDKTAKWHTVWFVCYALLQDSSQLFLMTLWCFLNMLPLLLSALLP